MNFLKYIKDNLLFILAYLLAMILTLVVVYLDLLFSNKSLALSSFIYILILLITILIGVVVIGYKRKKPFYKRLKEVTKQELKNMSSIGTATSNEELLFEEAWQNLYRLQSEKLQLLESKNKQNIYFLMQWAHHMKTPVAVTDLLIQKALEQELQPHFQIFVESIKEENKRLSEALSLLLNHARLQDFNVDFRIEKVSPLQIAREIINENRREYVAREVYPKIINNENIDLYVESDYKWLRFVLDQILTNALKYTAVKDGEKQITLHIKRSKGGFFLEIADTGIGIPKEDINRIFEPFYTGLNGRKYHKSTGIGLYLVNVICMNLSHEIEVESEENVGTKVRIFFPINEVIFSGLI